MLLIRKPAHRSPISPFPIREPKTRPVGPRQERRIGRPAHRMREKRHLRRRCRRSQNQNRDR